MRQMHISQVCVPDNRQRREFLEADITELAASIQSKGLMHAPVFREELDDADGSVRLVLVAGERRLKAIESLLFSGEQIKHDGQLCDDDCLPYTLLTDLTPEEYYEAELEENVRRVDLTWQELATAQAELHRLRSGQADNAGRKQTFRATAAEIDGIDLALEPSYTSNTASQVARSVILQEHLADPEVRAAKTEKDAWKVLEKKASAAHVERLAKEFDASTIACPHTLLEGDALELMPTIESGTINVLLTDPPYGIDADKFGEQSDQGHNYADSEEYFNNLTKALAKESFRFCCAKAHAYVFCDPRRFAYLAQAFTEAGWEVWPIPLIWKKNTGMLPRPEHAPRRTYEMIMYAIKGSKRVQKVMSDVIEAASVRNLQHGAQKPVPLYNNLLERSAMPGDRICDPFAGSGTIFPAAFAARCRAIGIERELPNIALCKTRMAGDESAEPMIDLGE